jgi:hypothetical protein
MIEDGKALLVTLLVTLCMDSGATVGGVFISGMESLKDIDGDGVIELICYRNELMPYNAVYVSKSDTGRNFVDDIEGHGIISRSLEELFILSSGLDLMADL